MEHSKHFSVIPTVFLFEICNSQDRCEERTSPAKPCCNYSPLERGSSSFLVRTDPAGSFGAERRMVFEELTGGLQVRVRLRL